MKDFELLKRTYPVSEINRNCDGFLYIFENTNAEERQELDINDDELQKIIKVGEKYIYQVAIECDEFKIMFLSFKNYEIIRKKLFKFNDE